jgi:hypothetical protein
MSLGFGGGGLLDGVAAAGVDGPGAVLVNCVNHRYLTYH